MDRPYGPRVVVSPLRAMNIKSALRDWLSVSYGMKTILLTGSLRSPPPIRLRHWTHLRWLFPPLVPYSTTFPPLGGGTIKHREAISPYATLS